jgi:long-chain fatty acid transport protein
MNRKYVLGCISSSVFFLVSSQNAHASGFRIPEVSIAGMGTANALVADSVTPGALAYNPAAMAFHEKRTLVAGVINIQPTASVKPDGGTNTDSQGDTNIQVPSFYYLAKIQPKLSWGLGINAPFGLVTKWPDETYPLFVGPADSLEPELSLMEMLNINPNLAYRIGKDTSIALGVDLYWVKSLVFNTQDIEIKGNGHALGWNVGLQHRYRQWSFGLSYRSSVQVDLDGTVDARDVGSTKSDASAQLEFPSLLQIGARYHINDDWSVEFDVERTGWSSFDVVEIDHASPGISDPIVNANEWENATAYRLGTSYQLSPQTQLRFGYTKDNSPQNGGLFSARVPDNNRQAIGAGFAHQMGRITLEASYMYAWLDEKVVNEPANSFLMALGSGSTDPNGTDAYNGTYNAHAHLIGLGLSATF